MAGQSVDPLVELLRRLRRQAGVSQVRLGELAGVSHRTIRNWETGVRDPKLPNWLACLSALGYRIAITPERGEALRGPESVATPPGLSKDPRDPLKVRQKPNHSRSDGCL